MKVVPTSVRDLARVAFLGPVGTFTHAALRQVVGKDQAEEVPCQDVTTALQMLRDGKVDHAVVPIENSVEGGVNATLDALSRGTHLVIEAEMLVPITFVLAGRTGTSLANVKRISTHPHAWAQCRGWLGSHLDQPIHVPSTSTAAAAKLLQIEEKPGFEAVLCAPISAKLYGLDVLATDVADNPGAITRFVLVSRPGSLHPPTGADKTTLVVHLPVDRSGALIDMLQQFAVQGVNLTRIESRPLGDALGRYSFSIDAEGHLEEERIKALLVGLRRVCPLVRFVGSYPNALGRQVGLLPGNSDSDYQESREWVMSLLETHKSNRY